MRIPRTSGVWLVRQVCWHDAASRTRPVLIELVAVISSLANYFGRERNCRRPVVTQQHTDQPVQLERHFTGRGAIWTREIKSTVASV